MYSRRVDSEIFYDRRGSVRSSKSTLSSGSTSGNSEASSFSTDHYNPTLRLLQIPRSSNGSLGFHLTRTKWDPYPWISAVDLNTPAKFLGLKAGECVLEINGEDILGLHLSDIANMVKSATEPIDSVSLLVWNAGSDTKCNPKNLCCGPMPLNLERLSACTQAILAIIECPVCLDTIAPPVLQCQNGHILCVKCRILSHTCPVCRQHFYPGRSLVAEQIYNSITDTFNLRNQSQMRLKLFGARYKSAIKEQRREKQQKYRINYKAPREVNEFGSQHHPHAVSQNNKFLAKTLEKSYSMDNLSSQSLSLLSIKRPVNTQPAEIVKNDDENDGNYDYDDDDDDAGDGSKDYNGKLSSVNGNFNEQLKLKNLFIPDYKPRPAIISKLFSLSAHDLSQKDNEGIIAIQQSPWSNSLKRLQTKCNSPESQSQIPFLPIKPSIFPDSGRKIACIPVISPNSAIRTKYFEDEHPLEVVPAKNGLSCCTKKPHSENSVLQFLCPYNCGKLFCGCSLQKHVKVEHCAPILCYSSSSAELSLPLSAPLDNALVLLMCEGKDFWIKLRTHGKGNITALALLQGSEDESSDFMIETRLRYRIVKDQDDNKNDDVKFDVNKDDGILERELITRSIVRSMMVTSWDETYTYDCKKEAKNGKDFLYNQETIRMAFGDANYYQNLLLKITIKRHG